MSPLLQRFRRLITPLGLDPLVPLLLVAAVVGGVSALMVEGFRLAMVALIHLYSAQDHLVAAATGLTGWQRALIPAVAAGLGGLVLWVGHRWVQGARGPEYMEAVRIGDGRLPLAPNFVRTGSSLLAVSGGITIGHEGTMIQFAALVSSMLGRWGRFDEAQRRLIVACGAAAGFAAAYHAPIAGTLFVAEIILGSLQLREVAAVLVAAVMGELTMQSLLGTAPLYLAPAVPPIGFADMLEAVVLGVLAGGLGPAFLWLLDASRHRCQALIRFLPVRMALAGLVIGGLSWVSPQVWGNGYGAVQSLLVQPWTLSAAALLFLLRLLAVSAASAAGIPGGVLTPTLALGAALGVMAPHVALWPHAHADQALWTLVGMGSLLAATTHAPAMSAIMMFEVTRDYNVVMAAMPACVIASVIGSLLRRRTVYSEALGLKEGDAPPTLGDASPPPSA